MTSALNLADQGFQVYLTENSDRLGGNALSIEKTIHGEEVKPFVTNLIRQVEGHPRIELFKKAVFSDLSGHVGHFKGKITQLGHGPREVEFGAAIIATGAVESKPTEYLYGEHPGGRDSAFSGTAHHRRRSEARRDQERRIHSVRWVPM